MRHVLLIVIFLSSIGYAAENEHTFAVILAPRKQAVISAEVPGRAVSIPKEFGQVFAAGDVLVELDNVHYANNLVKAEALLREAKSVYENTKVMHKQMLTVKRAEASMKHAQVLLKTTEKIVNGKFNESKVEADVGVAKANLKAIKELVKGNAANPLEVKSAERDYLSAQVVLKLTEADSLLQLEKARRDHSIASYDYKTAGMASEIELERARRAFEIARADVEIAKRDLTSCTITAPYDGRIVKLHINEHEMVRVTEPLLKIVDDKVLRAKFLVPSFLFTQILIGQKIQINVNEIKKRIPAKITHVSAVMDPASKTFEVYAEVDNSKRNLRSGMNGQIVIVNNEGKN